MATFSEPYLFGIHGIRASRNRGGDNKSIDAYEDRWQMTESRKQSLKR